MEVVDQVKVREIEFELSKFRHTYESMLKIFDEVNRKKKTLEMKIRTLEESRKQIMEGQIEFDFSF